MVQASAMNLDFLCSKLIKVLCRVQIAAVFGDLRYDRIAWEKVQRNRRFLDELPAMDERTRKSMDPILFMMASIAVLHEHHRM